MMKLEQIEHHKGLLELREVFLVKNKLEKHQCTIIFNPLKVERIIPQNKLLQIYIDNSPVTWATNTDLFKDNSVCFFAPVKEIKETYHSILDVRKN